MLTVLLTRHGHTDRSEPEQYLGQRVKASLSERGRRDAEALAARLAHVAIDRIVTSPLERALETARILAASSNTAVETDDRLTELDYGEWEGLTVEEIDRRFPGERELYENNPGLHQVGGGESGFEVAGRLAPLVHELLDWWTADGGDLTCLLVGHSSVNRILVALLLGIPLADYRRRIKQDWVSLTVLSWDEREAGPLLLLCNDLSHVPGPTGEKW